MKSQKGQSLVETALILPIIALFLFGIVDFGRILHTSLVLEHAGREIARAVSVGSEDIKLNETIDKTTERLDKSKLLITISPDKTKRTSGSNVTITLKYTVDLLTPILGQTIKTYEFKDKKTVMRVE